MKNLLLLFVILFYQLTFAQTYSIKGKVSDSQTGEPLIGANVLIQFTNYGAATDLDGNYEINNLSPGNYKLQISFIGYQTKLIDSLKIINGSIIVNVNLKPGRVFITDCPIVSASKYVQLLSDLPIKAEIIPQTAFSKNDFTNLEDALRYVPGINMTDDQISIRGSSGYSRGAGSRVMLTLDGIPIYTGDTGETIWEVIPTAVIKDVEIIKGAASSLYGSSAIGGVINVITRDFSFEPVTYFKSGIGFYNKPSYNEWDWSNQYRSFNSLTIGHSQKINKFSFGLSFSRLEDNSYRQNNFSKKYLGFLKAKYDFSNLSSLTLLLNTFNKRSGNFVYWKDSRNALVPPDADQGQKVATNRHLLGLIYKDVISDNFYYEARASYYYTNWDDGSQADNNSTTNLFRGEIQTTIKPFEEAVLVSGIEASKAKVRSNIFGNPASNSFGIYSQMDYNFSELWKGTLGLRFDYTKIDSLKSNSAVSPKIGLNYKPAANIILRAFAGTGFRAPTLAEAFTSTTSNGVTIKPNPRLKPENSFNVEIGSNYKLNSNIDFDASIFQNELYDFIEPGVDASDGKITFDNVTRARIQGFEFISNFSFLSNQLNISLSYNYLWTRDLNKKTFLKYRPRHSALIKADYKIGQFNFGSNFRYSSRVEEIDEELINLGIVKDGELRVAVYVLDFNAAYSFSSLPLKLYLNLKNTLNYNYIELIGNLEPPRNISLSLEMNF